VLHRAAPTLRRQHAQQPHAHGCAQATGRLPAAAAQPPIAPRRERVRSPAGLRPNRAVLRGPGAATGQFFIIALVLLDLTILIVYTFISPSDETETTFATHADDQGSQVRAGAGRRLLASVPVACRTGCIASAPSTGPNMY
jgi:hypothetical protein